jgi:hypothetical protein
MNFHVIFVSAVVAICVLVGTNNPALSVATGASIHFFGRLMYDVIEAIQNLKK